MLNIRFKRRISACAALAFGLAQTVSAQEPARDGGKVLTPMERAQRDAERVFSVIRKSAPAPAPQPRPAAKPVPRPVARAASAAASSASTEVATVQREAVKTPAARDAKLLDVPAPILPAPLATAVHASASSVTKPSTESRAEAPAARAAAAAAESSYLSQVHAYLESIKRYPSSREAREKRPSGIVRVWIAVQRSGQLAEAGVETSSGSMILDQEALRSVRSGRYPAFPSDAFAGQATRRFVIGMAYALSGGQ